MFERERINELLEALGFQLEELSATRIELVVIGGAALNCLGLIVRPTKDIDCMAYAEKDELGEVKLRTIDRFPEAFVEAVRIITGIFHLSENWINYEPSGLVEQGLPKGIENRLESKAFGGKLTIYFISRFDQICFKMYAAEQGPGRHSDDLIKLKPTLEELREAYKWCLTQDPSKEFKMILKDMLVKLGFKDVIEGL